MKYHELPATRQTKPLRVGRGISAGRGKTAGRGTKGQGARKSPTRIGFEGGQTPLSLRLPKLPGFKSHRVKAENVTTGQLGKLKAATIDNSVLAEAKLTTGQYVTVKLIAGGGELNAKKSIKLQAASAGAIAIIEKAGGTFEKIDRISRPKTKKSADKTRS